MTDTDKRYTIERVEEQTASRQETQDKLTEDPLDHLPDVSSQTGGLPIVTFILICLSGGCVMLIGKMLTSGSILVSVACVLVIAMVVFGMVALIRGMFTKLHNQNEKAYWYPLSAVIMAAGIVAGLFIGIFGGF